MKSAAELLAPRFEVIEKFPNSPYEIGDLLLFSEDKKLNFISRISGNRNRSLMLISFDEMKKYPHLFKKLEWWEKRTEEEMPKKLKSYSFPDETYIIKKWDLTIMVGYTDSAKRECCDLTIWQPESGYYPID